MATNFFFNNYRSSMEQDLIESLVTESIRIYGQDMYYLPRSLVNKDTLYQQDTTSEFNRAYLMEFYIKNVEGFQGQGDFFSKFGVEIRDRVTFTCSRKVFDEEIGSQESITRPNEGDLIYFPMNGKLFEIKFVEHESIFYQLGSLQTFDIQCELYENNNDDFNTGILEIDDKYTAISTDYFDWALRLESGDNLTTEDRYVLMIQDKYVSDPEDSTQFNDNNVVETEADNLIDWSEMDPFSEGQY